MDRKEYLRNYQRNWLRKRRNQWFKENGPCKECGSNKRLEVDHINPKTKITSCVWSWSKERREKELAKCQVLCYTCHKKKSAIENNKAHKGIPKYSLRKLTETQIGKMRKMYFAKKKTIREIAGIFGVHDSRVYRLSRGYE